MDWIVTTARTVEEAQTRALDLLGVDSADAEIQVIEEGKTGLFGRTKSEARVRARIKPKAPPSKDERNDRNDRNRNRNRNRNRGGGGGRGGNNRGGGNNRNNNNRGGGGGNQRGGKQSSNRNSGGNTNNRGGGGGSQAAAAAGAAAGAKAGGDGNRNRNRNRNRGGGGGRGGGNRRDDQHQKGEDRVEMPVDEQRATLEEFVTGVAVSFDPSATVQLEESEGTLLAKVHGEDLGRLIGRKAMTLTTLEELTRTAMHRAAAGRRYHRIQVDVDDYRLRRREALTRFATDLAESVAASGESKAMEPMGAADRKLVHDAVGEVEGVETISEGRDPRRFIVVRPLGGAAMTDEEE